MSHRITSIDRQEGLAQAWHGLTTVRKSITLDDNWLTQWDVEPRHVYIHDDNGKQKELPFVILTCTDNPNLFVGSPYNPNTFCPVTNAQFLGMIKEAVAGFQSRVKVSSLGSVRARGRTFVSLELDTLPAFKAGGRQFKPFLNFGNGHDRSSVLWVNTSNICTVCDNTFGFNLASVENKAKASADDDSFAHSQRHTRNITIKLPAISDLVDKAVGVQREFADAFESFAEQPLKADDARCFFTGILVKPASQKIIEPTRDKIDRLVHLFAHGKGNHGSNRADAFSAVTDYYTHESSGINASKEQQQFASEYGTGAANKSRAFSILRDDEKLAATVERGHELLTTLN